jgi:hypothetical protein
MRRVSSKTGSLAKALGAASAWSPISLVGSLEAALDEHMVERYLRHRARKKSIQPGDRAALKRLLAVLRDRTIVPAALPLMTPPDQMFEEFGDYLRRERGRALPPANGLRRWTYHFYSG